jgi:hypothetical protein
MKVPNLRKDTPKQLEYRIRYSNYGFVNGEWYYIYKRKPLLQIDIIITDDPLTDKRYQDYLEQLYNPLNDSF